MNIVFSRLTKGPKVSIDGRIIYPSAPAKLEVQEDGKGIGMWLDDEYFLINIDQDNLTIPDDPAISDAEDAADALRNTVFFNPDGGTGTPTTDASELTSGILPDERLSENVAIGAINSGSQSNLLAYYISSGRTLAPLSPITGSRALVSTGGGLPIHHNFTTAAEIGYVNGVTSSIQAQLNGKATPEDVGVAVAALVDSSPATLNTLNELAAALGNDPNFAATVIATLAGKVALSRTSPIEIIDVAARYGIVADGVTDNATPLMSMRSELAGLGKPHYILYFPYGIILYSNNRWLYGIEKFTVKGNGSTFRHIYTGADDMFHRAFTSGEMMQNNVLAYTGGKTYSDSYRFDTSIAGAKTITLTTTADADSGWVGKLAIVRYFDQVGNGYPAGDRYFEYVEIEGVNTGSGVVTFKHPLKNSYKSTVHDLAGYPAVGQSNGKPRLFILDGDPTGMSVSNFYCRYAAFEDLVWGDPTGGGEAHVLFAARELRYKNVTAETGRFFPSENELVIAEDCDFDKSEFDKLVNRVICNRVKFRGDVAGGFGCEYIELNDCSCSESVGLAPRILKINGGSFRGNLLPDTGGEAIKLSPAENPVRLIELTGDIHYSSGPSSTSDANIQIAPFRSHTIAAVSSGKIYMPDTGKLAANAVNFYTIEEGTTRMFKSDGSNAGLVTETSYDATYNSGQGAFVVGGDWLTDPVVSDVWKWPVVANIIDRAAHRSNDGKYLFSASSTRWKGNTSTGREKYMHITQKDLVWNPTAVGERQITFNGTIISADIFIHKPSADGKFSLQTIPDYTERFGLNFVEAGHRYFDAYVEHGLKTGDVNDASGFNLKIPAFSLITYNYNGANTAKDLPDFEIILKWMPF